MNGPVYFALGMIAGFLSVLLFAVVVTSNWRHFIWRLGGRTFRIVYDYDYFYPEKRFLWIFYVRLVEDGNVIKYRNRTLAVSVIEEFLEKTDKKRKSKKEILRFRKFNDKFIIE